MDFREKLNRGRSATGVVEGKCIARDRLDRARFVPARYFGRRDQRDESRSEGWSVQRLANVANGFLSARMPVQQAAASRQVEHGEADQHGGVTPQRL